MTRDELTTLAQFVEEFREFRIDDRAWKRGHDEFRRTIEAFVASEEAVKDREAARGVTRRAFIASAIAAAGVIASVALGIYNILT